MTAFFDTSVLVAAFFQGHEHHNASLRALRRATTKTGCCAAHSLAELYATTTRMPTRRQVTGDQVLLFLQNVREHLALVHLDARQYWEAIEHAASLGICGGTIYDSLILACAVKARARVIYTWNVRDFQRAYPALGGRIRAPA